MTEILLDTSLLLLVTVLLVVAFRHFRLPSVLAYLAAGILLGPHAARLIDNPEQIQHFAEIGIAFLMFSIGLEFSLPQMFAMRRVVLGLGGAQVIVTLLAVLGVCLAAGWGWQGGVALGAMVAMSSTAIVSRLLAERLELQTPHGRQIMGVLLFQDLAVVPLMIVLPALAAGSQRLGMDLAFALAKAAVVLALLLWVGRGPLRNWFHVVARSKSSELFVLNVLLVVLGLSVATQLAGLSLVLGAFLAGMLLSETEYRYQVEDYIKPFRDVLVGLFFVGLGMLLDLSVVLREFGVVLALALGMLLLKLALLWLVCRLYRNANALALRTALALAPAGEFGFVLLALARGLIPQEWLQVILAAMLLSMFTAPLILQYSDAIVLRLVRSEWMQRALAVHDLAVKTLNTSAHVIVCGYGRSGQSLARLLQREEVRTLALDHDPQRVQEAAAAGEPVVFGDAQRREVLLATGIQRAAAVVVSFAQTDAALRILSHVRDLAPGVPVIVRTYDDTDLERLQQAGATEVVPEVVEGALMLASHAMLVSGLPLARVLKRIRETRRARYDLMRGFFPGASDEEAGIEEVAQPRLHSVMLGPDAYAAGKRLADLHLEDLRVEVTALRRANRHGVMPAPELELEGSDVVVLLGEPGQLALAEERLLRGSG
jgi:monovalent cation:H+ antiporter-2, CPA2 family